MAQSCLELSRDQAGCCILQVCIEYAIGEVQEAFVSPLIQDAENLSRHVYGYFLMIYTLRLFPDPYSIQIYIWMHQLTFKKFEYM